jgi:hypothetical protein
MPEPIFMRLGIYIMVPEPISTAYLINPSHKFVCLYVYLLVAMQRIGKSVTAATNTHNNRRTVEGVVFYAVRVVWKEIRLLILPRNSRYISFSQIYLNCCSVSSDPKYISWNTEISIFDF